MKAKSEAYYEDKLDVFGSRLIASRLNIFSRKALRRRLVKERRENIDSCSVRAWEAIQIGKRVIKKFYFTWVPGNLNSGPQINSYILEFDEVVPAVASLRRTYEYMDDMKRM